MKILVLTSRFPYPLEKGDKLRIYFQLKEIAKKHQVVLVAVNENHPTQSHLEQVEKIVHKVYVQKISAFTRIINLIKALFNKKPFRNAYFYSDSTKKEIQRIIDKENPDHIHCHLIRMAEYVKDISIPKSLDYMDAFSFGLKKRADSESVVFKKFYKVESQRTAVYEKNIYPFFNKHTIISQQDRRALPVELSKHISIVKNGIALDFFTSTSIQKKYDLAFVGNLGYYPNIHAVSFIKREIIPHFPNLQFLIAGARPAPSIQALQNNHVTVLSWLDDIRDAYNQSKIFIAPLFVGIGQQNKILEAMAMGVVCITTRSVNNAIGATPDHHLLLADTAEEFKSQINKLIQHVHLYQSIQVNAREFVEKSYSWPKVTEPLIELFE